ncbi:hypothetical protein G6F16_011752 [Rhizopus arrhizus]|nr:hypothetical protein G6F24_000487 [Rhizopus arrhizus]KAG0797942.1 hypothetical protein G6F21_000135 [Rhizopus arrhizus]KAG0859957.1 hypothetical protein G6F17_001434 [Rhizopus arrhizus]KAG0863505.1 hypothetical protein G6F16_011752 [Rhizopus arrhizus]KAG0887895.1 hypothetical protein G6F15_002040 [Rhizopus arrhizus]
MSENTIPPYLLTPSHDNYLKALPPIDMSLLTIDILRKVYPKQSSDIFPKVDVLEEKVQIPAKNKEGVVYVDIYKPKNTKSDGPLPVLLFLPGGGWCVQPLAIHSFVASKLSNESQCAVVLVNYSLSPEVKFPVALEECFLVLQWILDTNNSKQLSIDPNRIAVAGDSAGGNLAAALTRHAIKRQILYYPILDATWSTESYKEYGDKNYFSSLDFTQLMWKNYQPAEPESQNILACPSKATFHDLQGLPPAFIVTSHLDTLRDEAEAYGRQLMMANVPVSTMRVMHAIHGFLSIDALFCEESFNVIDASVGVLRRTFS